MTPEPTSCPSRERDVADHDQAYTWGRSPSTYLAPREIARLMILRCRLEERQELRHRGRAPRSGRRTASRQSS
jgi:hypothetical protein